MTMCMPGVPLRDETQKPLLIGVVGGVIAVVICGMRMMSGLPRGGRKLGWDDWTIMIALALSMPPTVFAVLLSNNGQITSYELPPEVTRSNGSMPLVTVAPMGAPAAVPAGESSSGANTSSLRDVEKQQIISALERVGWHRGKAAEMLGISPSTLYRRLRDYNLEGRLR